MTRRILTAFLGLTLALLIGVVVPLGVLSVDHDRKAFAAETVSAASALASAAEEQLADHEHGAPFPGTLTFRPALVGNDQFAVYDNDGRVVIPGPAGLQVDPGQVAAALRGRTVQQWQDEPHEGLLVLRPAYSGSQIVGAAAVQRAADPLNEQIATLWFRLALTGLLAILLATTLSIGLARWVGRPLRRLDTAADRLGAGQLSVRASTEIGPPETRHLARTFNDMAGRLESLIGSHRTLVADISHQLRTPLAALRLRLELLHDDVGAAAAGELEGALDEIARLSRLVDGLLAVARAEHTRPVPLTVDLRRLVIERVSIWSALAQERQIQLLTSCEEAAVAATAGHLEQVLDNLLANALDVTPGGGQITVSVRRHDDRVRLEVIDNGPGMTSAQREHAFRRFWTQPADKPARDSSPRSGLGLAIVHRLITVDGGTIELTNVPGHGLAVQIDLHPATG
ncbi:MAG: HAMP domain-containing sensor histidine kinase [Actinomycetota bacterium]